MLSLGSAGYMGVVVRSAHGWCGDPSLFSFAPILRVRVRNWTPAEPEGTLGVSQPTLPPFPISSAFFQHPKSSLCLLPLTLLSFHHTVSDGQITKVFSDKDIQISPSQPSGVPNHLPDLKVGLAGGKVIFLVPPITCSHENKHPKSRKPQTVLR